MSNIAKVEDARWLDHLPDDWKIQKVKQVYNLQVGFTPDTKKDVYYDDENGFEWLTITDLTTDRIIPKSTEKHISKKYVDEYTPKIIPAGSLLYSFKLSLGQVAFTDREIYSNEAIASFLADKDVCLPYLYYSSCFIELNANENIYGAKLLNQQLIKNAYIPVPPLSDQKAIANFLDEKCSNIDNAIEKQKAVVEKLKEYRQSVITEAVTKGLDKDVEMKETSAQWFNKIPFAWHINKFKYVAPLRGEKAKEDKSNYIALENIEKFTAKKIGEQYEPDGDANHFETNDVLFGKLRPYLSKSYLPTNSGCCSGELLVMIPKKIMPKYLLYITLNTKFVKCVDDSTYGAKMPRANWTFIGNLLLPVPPQSEQQQIVDYLDNKCSKIDEAIARSNGIIEKLEEYKKSLIYEYVTGKKEVPFKYYEVKS